MDEKYFKITEYAREHRVFTTEEAVKSLGVSNRAYFNTVLSRACANGRLYRYRRGVYGVMEESIWLKRAVHPSTDEAIRILYIKDESGFETGPGLLNGLGLTTQVPNTLWIATNKVSRISEDLGARLIPPRTRITPENIDVLRILDALMYMSAFPVDATDPYKLLSPHARGRYPKLFEFAEKHYNAETQTKLYELARWEACHVA